MNFKAELGRKSIHLLPLSIPIGALTLDRALVMFILFGLTCLFLTADVLRLYIPPLGRIFWRVFGPLLRQKERYVLVGSTYYLIGASLAFIFYQQTVAVTAVFFLILGDMAAAIVGRRWGVPRLKGKSFEGSLACLATCLLVVFAVPDLPVRPALLGALTATLVELLPLGVNDNLSIPLISGGVMELLI
jgi:dolichol kinase